MPSPNFDAASVSLSVMLADNVATAATNGKTYLVTDRESLLNRAQKLFFENTYQAYERGLFQGGMRLNANAPETMVANIIRDCLVYTTAVTTGTSLIVISGLTRFLELVNLVDVATTRYITLIDRTQIPLLLSGYPRYTPSTNNPMCYYDVTNITVLPNNATYQTKTMGLTYIQTPDFALVNGGANDFQWSAKFIEDIKLLALAYSKLDNGDAQGYELLKTSVFNNYFPPGAQ